MLRATQLIGFGAGSAGFSLLSQITDYTSTTNIGTMTGSGGLAAAFDGTTAQAAGSCASAAPGGASPASVGKQWAGGLSKTIGRFIVYDPSNEGHASSAASVTLSLYGKNGAPASPTDGTLLFTSPSQSYVIGTTSYDTTAVNGIDVSSAYTHHWITLTPSGTSSTLYIAEVVFYEWL
ncbi:MAG: hypothetical protein ACKVSF_11115 [Alphaproteobacteria bacterium]